MTDNIYLQLTEAFNRGRTRAIVSSGQAVVLHRLAIMSKDGDWIVRENPEDLAFIRDELGRRGATYRFGAPLDERWLAGGWSSHFEFAANGMRVRCDFFSRPPRLSANELGQLWEREGRKPLPYLDVESLVRVKQTQREKDYAVIGELARKLPPERQLLCSRSARDLIELASRDPDMVSTLISERPLLGHAVRGDREALEESLDRERRSLMRADEERLDAYAVAAAPWRAAWPGLQSSLGGVPLGKAHAGILQAAEGVLPFNP
ncbi:hypothetical protein [Haloferula sp. A504]|uniref:hypothetical protein n=1 Tax=Haloferula sp. A504 TaxID=3373601 RepID=UPI0031C85440|nr:hypothetical protein [Verrucomicrobiaceae bacterium E54]